MRLKLYEVGLLRIRINEMVNENAARQAGRAAEPRGQVLRSVREGVSSDGALGSRGALMVEEYSDYPGFVRGTETKRGRALAELGTELLRLRLQPEGPRHRGRRESASLSTRSSGRLQATGTLKERRRGSRSSTPRCSPRRTYRRLARSRHHRFGAAAPCHGGYALRRGPDWGRSA